MDRVNIIVFTQHVRLEAVVSYQWNSCIDMSAATVFVTTHYLFENEKHLLRQYFPKCIFTTFSDYLTDREMKKCDEYAYRYEKNDCESYYCLIKKLKNKMVIHNLEKKYRSNHKFILSNDLGIDFIEWNKAGFTQLNLKYYYHRADNIQSIQKKQESFFSGIEDITIFSAVINKKKYVFIGNNMNRIGYRLSGDFKKETVSVNCMQRKMISTYIVNRIIDLLPEKLKCILRDNAKTVYLTTIHEYNTYKMKYGIKNNTYIIQDGYLPDNYTSLYMRFYKGYQFYAWDKIGKAAFENYGVKAQIMPIRKKLYLPYPEKTKKIRTILVATSGAGDWTAMKNRSDEDKMAEAFAKAAQLRPDIKFIYRCHPVWIFPQHQGINSIKRVKEYFDYLDCENIKVSDNILDNRTKKMLSLPRTSFEQDLAEADIVFGEHSIAMLDAGFEKKLFASVNVTERRNFFRSFTDMGFPHCKSVEDILDLINYVENGNDDFYKAYNHAIDNFNVMTDKEQ